ncbi:unnamed protein product [Ilex paraguariensis]|uniref:F-box domain-containing protein n=1 Tax=Ilex paraguariensis TaxID=185542 RepID=A0ABC8SVR5_9AQUA
MSVLPDELWRRILEFGISSSSKNPLNYKDICCVAITCRRLNRLSYEDSLWSSLLSSQFPNYENPNNINFNRRSTYPSPSSKTIFKIRFERERERRLLGHRRAVLRVESQIGEHSRKLREIESRVMDERVRMKATTEELSNLLRVR